MVVAHVLSIWHSGLQKAPPPPHNWPRKINNAEAGVIEEIVNDVVDTALDSEDLEEETKEDEVDKVLAELAGEIASQLQEAIRKERTKQPTHEAKTAEGGAIIDGVDDEEELEEIRVRLARVRT
ncbi:hypothetical protein IFM89_012178 [Coptis chinensis]|uniref:Uncharacterized protein n=1 Tax=Coptis chinensis TaxID=261450 RepID=A0A835HGJ7_9MAGN|nr:hypothetical protein IFM89_012178 [Coptis chinensis]